MRARPSAHLPAGRVSADIWASWLMGKCASRPAAATSWAGWGTAAAKCTLVTPLWRPPRRLRGSSCIPTRSSATRCRRNTAMAIRGHARKVGHHIDTDVIIPARYLVTTDPAELAKYVFEDLDPSLRQRIAVGDVLVAGENFGQGSSREHAPIAIKGVGLSCIVAVSFARIFYRNAFNVGLPVVECRDAHARASDGDELDVDLATGVVRNVTRGETYEGTPVPEFRQRLLAAGRIGGYWRAELAGARERGGGAGGVGAGGPEHLGSLFKVVVGATGEQGRT